MKFTYGQYLKILYVTLVKNPCPQIENTFLEKEKPYRGDFSNFPRLQSLRRSRRQTHEAYDQEARAELAIRPLSPPYALDQMDVVAAPFVPLQSEASNFGTSLTLGHFLSS
jgi:hypothetical protein